MYLHRTQKQFKSTYIMHIDRILNQHTAIIKSCDTDLNSQLTKALFNCVKSVSV